MSEPKVTVEKDGHVLLVGVDRAAKRNAWDLQVIDEVAAAYDRLAAGAGLEPVERWSTWDREPWRDDADWCVAVHRRPDDS